MKSIVRSLFMVLAVVAALIGCDGLISPNVGDDPGVTDGGTVPLYMDSTAFTGEEGVPAPPDVVMYGIDSRALEPSTENESGGTFYGELQFAQQVTVNYSSTMQTLQTVESSLGDLTMTSLSSGSFTHLYSGQISGEREVRYYTNGSANHISLVVLDPSNNDEIRQLDYVRTTNYKYGRVIFSRAHIDGMLDVTEVREFNRRKEFSSARTYQIGTPEEFSTQLVGMTELVSGVERTTAIRNMAGEVTTNVDFGDDGRIGILDLTMTAVVSGSYPDDHAEVPADFPKHTYVLAIGNWCHTPADLATVTYDFEALARFAGFDG